ncbi:hypothetical protein HGRIS_013852 [Hohenbuehelia grisea]|uniref:DUF6593 domain-containing protein n=1 Tax=Hohenbuehelia grisea TaxID=104357 RepID=A0ABR3IX05_9AGAR
MHLYFLNNSALNTTLVDDSGDERYTVATPWRWSRRTTTISKTVWVPERSVEKDSCVTFSEPPTLPDSPASEESRPSLSTLLSSSFLSPKSSELAQIQWHCISNSRLKLAGCIECDLREYLVRSGLLGRLRTFTASDGQSYQWSMGVRAPVLYRNDHDRVPVARFHGKRFGVPGICKPRDAFLEILPAGEHIADSVVMTFVYIEKRRRDS